MAQQPTPVERYKGRAMWNWVRFSRKAIPRTYPWLDGWKLTTITVRPYARSSTVSSSMCQWQELSSMSTLSTPICKTSRFSRVSTPLAPLPLLPPHYHKPNACPQTASRDMASTVQSMYKTSSSARCRTTSNFSSGRRGIGTNTSPVVTTML